MKRSVALSSFVLGIVILTSVCSNLSAARETRNISGFTKVNFGISGDLYISFGNEFKLVIEGDQSILDNVLTEVSESSLVIKKRNWRQNMNEKVTVYITMPEIEGLSVSGSGKAEIKDAIEIDDLSLSVSGSGKLLTSDLEVDELRCRISGSGDIILGGKGSVSEADIAISGSGSFNGESAKVNSLEVSISGSGNCTCYASDVLSARVSGSGNISYLGNPKVDARISGSGKVRSR